MTRMKHTEREKHTLTHQNNIKRHKHTHTGTNKHTRRNPQTHEGWTTNRDADTSILLKAQPEATNAGDAYLGILWHLSLQLFS